MMMKTRERGNKIEYPVWLEYALYIVILIRGDDSDEEDKKKRFLINSRNFYL